MIERASTVLCVSVVAFVLEGACSQEPAASAAGGSGGTACPPGTETCACYGNGTCNSDLVCASNLCVQLRTGGAPSGGTGGAVTTTGGSGGMPAPTGGSGGDLAPTGGIGGTDPVSTGGTGGDAGATPMGGSAGVSLLADGEVCTAGAECAGGNCCFAADAVQGTCTGVLPCPGVLGDPCDGDAECIEGFCSDATDGFCTRYCTRGTSCGTTRGGADLPCLGSVGLGDICFPSCDAGCSQYGPRYTCVLLSISSGLMICSE